MNCKNCGKRLSEQARYCDRCGSPIKNSSSGRGGSKKTYSSGGGTAVATKTSTRSKDSYDNYRKKKMQRELEQRRRRRKARIAIVWIIFLAIIGAVGGGLYAYTYMMRGINDQTDSTPTQVVQVATQTAEATEDADETPEPKPTATPEQEDDNPGCEVYIDRAYGFKCAYPADFDTGSLMNKNTRLSLESSSGDAQVLICYEKINKSDTASGLLKDYVDGLGVDAEFKKSGDKWYSVTFIRNGRIQHRKAVIMEDNQLVYYDFAYDQGSDNKNTYEDYIDYMDDYIEKQMKSKKS